MTLIRSCHWLGQPVLAALVLLFALAGNLSAAEIVGRVVGVTDGDTLTLLSAGNVQTRIRLAEIDAPEKSQPYGDRAKQALSDLTFNKDVRVEVVDTDRYGRTVGKIFVGSVAVNAELVRQGAVWVYRQYLHDQSLIGIEEEARTAHRGLWALPEEQRIPPWEWRHAGRANASTPESRDVPRPQIASPTPSKGIESNNHDFQCGEKRYCNQMSSCAEAQFYLHQCGLTRLDGDGDGVPCEKLCR